MRFGNNVYTEIYFFLYIIFSYFVSDMLFYFHPSSVHTFRFIQTGIDLLYFCVKKHVPKPLIPLDAKGLL